MLSLHASCTMYHLKYANMHAQYAIMYAQYANIRCACSTCRRACSTCRHACTICMHNMHAQQPAHSAHKGILDFFVAHPCCACILCMHDGMLNMSVQETKGRTTPNPAKGPGVRCIRYQGCAHRFGSSKKQIGKVMPISVPWGYVYCTCSWINGLARSFSLTDRSAYLLANNAVSAVICKPK